MPTAAEVLGRALRAAGVRRVFGQAIAGAPCLAVLDDPLATLLADVAGHLGPAPGVAYLGDRRLRVSSRPGGRAVPVVITDPVDLVVAIADACDVAGGPVPATAELALELDLDAPAEPSPPRSTTVGRGEASGPGVGPGTAASVAVLAGPGVVRTGRLDAVRAFAAAGGLGVANTWGAKGMFAWDSPHHLGTCGLQAHDFALLGFADVDLLVVSRTALSAKDPGNSAFGSISVDRVYDDPIGVDVYRLRRTDTRR